MRAPGSSFLREQVVVNDGPKASAARFMQGVDTRAHRLPTYLPSAAPRSGDDFHT